MTIQILLGAINWGMVGWVLVGAVVLIVVVAAVGRAIAAAFPPNPEHMSHFRKPAAARVPAPVAPAAKAPAPAVPVASGVPATAGDVSPEILAVIAAAVSVALRGKNFAITNVVPAQPKAPDIEQLMSLWSLEGRRQVYSSHTFSHTLR